MENTAPKTPTKAKAPPKAPTPVKAVETTEVKTVETEQVKPNIVKVKHKVTGKEFEVSRKYYETYNQVLDLV